MKNRNTHVLLPFRTPEPYTFNLSEHVTKQCSSHSYKPQTAARAAFYTPNSFEAQPELKECPVCGYWFFEDEL
jgi:hypothetical protein